MPRRNHTEILHNFREDPLFLRAAEEELRDTPRAFAMLSKAIALHKLPLARFPKLAARISRLAAACVENSDCSIDTYQLGKNFCGYSTEPHVFTINRFLSAEDCAKVIALSRWRMQRAKVQVADEKIVTDGRSGSNCWLKHHESPITLMLAHRLSALVNVPLTHAEGFQCIHYDVKQQYRNHYDTYVDDGSEGSEQVLRNGGQRIFTALIYLNRPSMGGQTRFTKLDHNIAPDIGRLLVFTNVYEGTNLRHPLSEHAGLSVTKGEKWAMTTWFREKPVA
jgi:prolyl 4-hydroxylase